MFNIRFCATLVMPIGSPKYSSILFRTKKMSKLKSTKFSRIFSVGYRACRTAIPCNVFPNIIWPVSVLYIPQLCAIRRLALKLLQYPPIINYIACFTRRRRRILKKKKENMGFYRLPICHKLFQNKAKRK